MFKMSEEKADKISARLGKITSNPWFAGLQSATMKTVPLAMVSGIVSIYDVICKLIPNCTLPSLGKINDYSFGLTGLFIAYTLAFELGEKLKDDKKHYMGYASAGTYMMLMNPVKVEQGMAFTFNYFGGGGMVVAIICGYLAAALFRFFKKLNIFSEDSVIPDFVKQWFECLLPFFTTLLFGWICVDLIKINAYNLFTVIFAPILTSVQTLGGAILFDCLKVLFYGFGVSIWVWNPLTRASGNYALAANMEAWANGIRENLPYKMQKTVGMGGVGDTLALTILMSFSKSKRLQLLGRTFVWPGIININEPVIFSVMLFNPTLIIPAILCAIAMDLIWWIGVTINFIQPLHITWGFWYFPRIISHFAQNGWHGVIVCVIMFVASLVIYYPFFKKYEKKVLEEDNQLD